MEALNHKNEVAENEDGWKDLALLIYLNNR